MFCLLYHVGNNKVNKSLSLAQRSNIYKNKNRKKSIFMIYKCVRMATETEISRYSGIPNKCIPVSKGMNTPVWLNFTFTTTQGGLMLRKERLRFKHEYDSVTFLTNNYLKEAA